MDLNINDDIFQFIESEEDVDYVCQKIIGMTGVEDKFWDDMAGYLMKALLYYLRAEADESEQTLSNCLYLLKNSEQNDDNNELKKRISKLPVDHPAPMYFKTVEMMPEKTYASIVKHLESILEKLV